MDLSISHHQVLGLLFYGQQQSQSLDAALKSLPHTPILFVLCRRPGLPEPDCAASHQTIRADLDLSHLGQLVLVPNLVGIMYQH